MKKKIASVLALALALCVVAAPAPVMADEAEEEGTMFAAAGDSEKGYKVTYDTLESSTEMTEKVLYDGWGYISLKPETVGKIGTVTFTFDVDHSGEYLITVVYAASQGSAARKLDRTVNSGATENIELVQTSDWNTLDDSNCVMRVDLKKGTNVIRIATPADYDNSLVKTPNVYAVEYELLEEKNLDVTVKTSDTLNVAFLMIACSMLVLSGICFTMLKKKEIH